jgi:hypothetical protein
MIEILIQIKRIVLFNQKIKSFLIQHKGHLQIKRKNLVIVKKNKHCKLINLSI